MKLIAYLSNGYPNLEESFKRAERFISIGVDVLEVDIPASNPYLDNDLLKSRIKIARKNTENYDDYLDAILRIKNEFTDANILVNVYEDTIKEIGIEKFIKFMYTLGEKNILLAGSNFPEIRKELEEAGLYISSFITKEMKDEDLTLAKNSNGFIYMEGFGSSEENSIQHYSLKERIKKVRDIINNNRDIYVGIGVHTQELFQEVYDSGADGVFLGSIIIKEEDNLDKQTKLIESLKNIASGK